MSFNMAVLHYTESPDVSAATVDGWHRQRGFTPRGSNPLRYIGYHYLIRQSGAIELGRSTDVQGTHCPGYNRSDVLAICSCGSDKEPWYPAVEQYASIVVLLKQHSIIPGRIYFHRDLYSTSCPGRLSGAKILNLMSNLHIPELEKETKGENEMPFLELDRMEGDDYVFILNSPAEPNQLLRFFADVDIHDFSVTIYAHVMGAKGFIKHENKKVGGYANRDGVKGMDIKIEDLTYSNAAGAWITIHSPFRLHGWLE